MIKTKKIISAVLVVALTLSLCACGKKKTDDKESKAETKTNTAEVEVAGAEGAEEAVADMLEALKSLDFKKAEKYINLNDIKVSDGEGMMAADADTIFKAVFGKLEYKIISSEQTGKNEASVLTEITAVDIQPIVNEYFKNMLQFALENAFAEAKTSDAENKAKANEFFTEAAEKNSSGTVTSEVSVKAVKEGKNFKIVVDKELSEALTGKILYAIDNMPDSFDYSQD